MSARLPALIGAAAALLLAACTGGAYEATPVPPTGSAAATTASGTAAPSPSATTASSCPPAGTAPRPQDLRSYTPDAKVTGGRVAEIRKRGRLIAGVSADTLTMGSRNPVEGTIEGFDIDRLHAIAKALLGDPNAIEFRVITTAQRIPVLKEPVENGGVDIVARTMSITCDRWTQVAFSGVYYVAGQKVLVPTNSPAQGLDDLAGKKVCAPRGSTSIAKLEDFPEVKPVGADTHTGCLVLLQQGGVDAITGDDTILAGLAAQDPYTKVVGERLTDEFYGLAMPAGSAGKSLVRFVNSVLEREKDDGSWARSYAAWLQGPLKATATPPAAAYGRP